MWAISRGKSYHKNCSLWKNGPRWLIFEFLLENRLLRGREWSSLLVHASTTLLVFSLSVFPCTLHCFFLIYVLPLFFLIFLLLSFLLISLCYLLSLPPTVHSQGPFYTACRDEFYCFTLQLLLSGIGCHSQTTHWFVSCLAITISLCWLCHIPFPDNRVLFCFLTLHGIPIRIRVVHSLLLTPMACI